MAKKICRLKKTITCGSCKVKVATADCQCLGCEEGYVLCSECGEEISVTTGRPVERSLFEE